MKRTKGHYKYYYHCRHCGHEWESTKYQLSCERCKSMNIEYALEWVPGGYIHDKGRNTNSTRFD